MALQVKTFHITDEAGEAAVGAFLQGKRVHHWQSAYSADPSGWNLLIAYEEDRRHFDRDERDRGRDRERREPRISQPRTEPRKPERIEHVPELPPEDMPLYENIRKWRNTVAREEKIKPYILFNNKQLEDLVKAKPKDADSLKAITSDITPEHFEKYGNELLGLVSGGAVTAD
ncbi:MAG: HRDC domain-containing protein [Bacteroidota bacterium]|nr:HRDC domain-containing protein [Bacteroidota bacterium]MDP4235939.1 HRDC domain-containing protein [Bacteroidota bacterium]